MKRHLKVTFYLLRPTVVTSKVSVVSILDRVHVYKYQWNVSQYVCMADIRETFLSQSRLHIVCPFYVVINFHLDFGQWKWCWYSPDNLFQLQMMLEFYDVFFINKVGSLFRLTSKSLPASKMNSPPRPIRFFPDITA